MLLNIAYDGKGIPKFPHTLFQSFLFTTRVIYPTLKKHSSLNLGLSLNWANFLQIFLWEDNLINEYFETTF